MSRQNQVTRTATTSLMQCKISKGEDCKIIDKVVKVPARVADDETKLKKAIISSLEPDEVFIRVVGRNDETHLYGMPETEFFKYAKILDTIPE